MTKVCGIALDRIGIIIGVIHLIHSIIFTIYTPMKLASYMERRRRAESEGWPIEDDKETTSILAVAFSISVTGIITSSLLIWGTIKKKPLFLLPWLYISCVLIVITGFYIFTLIYSAIWHRFDAKNYSYSENVDDSVIKIVILLLTLAFQIAIYKAIKLLYTELIFEREMQRLETSSTIYIIHEVDTDDYS